MRFLHTLTAGAALLTLTACSTFGGGKTLPSADSILLGGVDVPSVSQGVSVAQLSASNPTCLKFYENVSSFVAIPTSKLALDVPGVPGAPGVPGVPSGPSFGSSLLKTVILGTLSGVVSGGVASLGISNSFAEAALIGTATQVTYNTGETVYDSILAGKDEAPDPSTPEGQAAIAAEAAAKAHDVGSHTHDASGNVIPVVPAAGTASAAATSATASSPHLAAIESAAAHLGCPAPDATAIAALKL